MTRKKPLPRPALGWGVYDNLSRLCGFFFKKKWAKNHQNVVNQYYPAGAPYTVCRVGVMVKK